MKRTLGFPLLSIYFFLFHHVGITCCTDSQLIKKSCGDRTHPKFPQILYVSPWHFVPRWVDAFICVFCFECVFDSLRWGINLDVSLLRLPPISLVCLIHIASPLLNSYNVHSISSVLGWYFPGRTMWEDMSTWCLWCSINLNYNANCLGDIYIYLVLSCNVSTSCMPVRCYGGNILW
jgi:hypothetical protein